MWIAAPAWAAASVLSVLGAWVLFCHLVRSRLDAMEQDPSDKGTCASRHPLQISFGFAIGVFVVEGIQPRKTYQSFFVTK